MIRSYKFRIYPNNEQMKLMNKNFGSVRFVYNYFLELKSNDHSLKKYDSIKMLSSLKNEYEWLKENESSSLQQTILDLFTAFNNFFSQKSFFPKRKKKSLHKDSYRIMNNNNNIEIINNKLIKLPKLKNMKIKIHREIIGKIKNVTISRKPSGKCYVSILTESDSVDFSLPKTNQNVGVDLGVHSFVTLSNGMKFDNLHLIENNLDKLIKLQQNLSRKEHHSKNREKARIKLAKQYEKINNQKKDYLHKLSKFLVTQFDKIAIEDLEVSSMIVDDLDSRIAKHNINRSLLSMNFREFRTMLEYKCKKYEKELIIVDRYFPSSQICSSCGERNQEIKNLNIRNWVCPYCNSTHDRDVNAAINLLNRI